MYIVLMKEIIKRIIADFHQNPTPFFRKRALEVPLSVKKIITIIGPRRSGKTFYLYQIMANLEKQGVTKQECLYLNFEDERLNFDGGNDAIFDAYRELYPNQDLSRVYLFFDEIQELPGWEKFIRRVNDSITNHIFLTGSNSRLLSKDIASSLRGRSLSFEILPLSFSEFLSFRDLPQRMPVSSRDTALVKNAFDHYCLWGGFPELVDVTETFKVQILQEYFNVMLYRDLVERYRIRDTAIAKYVLKRLVASFTKEFSVNKLYNELKSKGFSIGKETLYRMVDEIFSIYMLASVERYDPSVVRREMSNKKVYLYDNGFATALNASFAEDRGKRLENSVFRYLRGQTEEIYFARNGWECDFVVFVQGKKPQLVQVAWQLNRENIDRELKGLISSRKSLDHADAFLIVDHVEPGLDVPEWVRVVPVVEWLLSGE